VGNGSVTLKRAALVSVMAFAMAAAPTSCAQILGAQEAFTLEQESGVIGESDSAHDFETSTNAACPAGQKMCSGACVAADDPEFGCDPSGCLAPCSLPHVPVAKCVASQCAVATCAAGWSDCNAQGKDGCEADTTSPATCNDCKVACAATELCAPSPTGCTKDCGSLTACQDGRCVDTTNSTHDCGGCVGPADVGKACTVTPAGHANAVCTPTVVSGDAGADGGDGGSAIVGICGFICGDGYGDCNKDPSDGCEQQLLPYFADLDGDGYGGGTSLGLACSPPAGRFAASNDCQDNDARVHPGQTTFFPTSYLRPDGVASFNYNCDGVEEADPSLATGGTCVPSCVPGYVPTSTTSNPYCGSITKDICTVYSGVVSCNTQMNAAPLGCR
jgi:hypothetical protein